MRRFTITAVVLAGCESGGAVGVDAMPDAAVPVVALSSCPTTVAATVVDSPSTFIPKMTTIRAGEIVKFMINAEHFVLPNTSVMTDPALQISRGETKCFRFAVPGTYGFLCGVHSFVGTITVE